MGPLPQPAAPLGPVAEGPPTGPIFFLAGFRARGVCNGSGLFPSVWRLWRSSVALERDGGGFAAGRLRLGVTACASDDHPDRGERGFRGEGGESGPPPARPSLFISPAGEPFRAGPGEPYPVAVWFRGADANGDGKLTRDEFVADAARYFQTLDLNHDGVIDGQELKAYETENRPRGSPARRRQAQPAPGGRSNVPLSRPGTGPAAAAAAGRWRWRSAAGGGEKACGGAGGQQPGGGPGGGMPQAQGAAPYGLLGDREPVASADLDLNSRITLANFRTKAAQRFVRLDADGKGYLLIADLPKTAAQQGGGRSGRGGPDRPPAGG